MSSSLIHPQVTTIIAEARAARAFPGAQVWLSRGQTPLLNEAFGAYTYETNSPTVTTETLYDIASVTKTFTLAVFLIAAREAKISSESRVAQFLPEFDTNDKRDISLRHLLNHTSGIGFAIQSLVPAVKEITADEKTHLAIERENAIPCDQWIARIAEAPLHHAIGDQVLYSCTNYFLLARLIEQWSAKPLDDFLTERLLKPLQMQQTTISPPEEVAPTEMVGDWAWRGVVHDEAARQWWYQTGGLCGNAGLFSTAGDLARFGQLWLQEGIWENQQILNAEDVQLTWQDWVQENETTRRGWCWQIDAQYFMSEDAPPNSAGHTGFTGPSFWFHPPTQQLCIVLNNRVYPTRDGPIRMPFHRRIAQLLCSPSP
jgi:CubicO group peptidase (beta-lactamase class C family)